MSTERKNLISGIFFLLFAAFVYAESYAIKMTKADSLGPQFFPRLVAFFTAALAIYLIVSSILKMKRETAPTEKTGFHLNVNLLLTCVILVAYFLLVKTVGFVVLTAVYLFLQMLLLLPKGSVKNKKYMIITAVTSVVVPVFIYLLFYKVFQIFLPAGILG